MYRSYRSIVRVDQARPRSTAPLIPARDGLVFPAQSRARLDRSLEEIVVVARKVLSTESRLRNLLDANLSVARCRDPSFLLAEIVNSAVRLVDARSGVLDLWMTSEHLGRLARCGTDADRPIDAQTIESRLELDGETFGILSLCKEGADDFSAEDAQLLASFADVACIALWNAGNPGRSTAPKIA